MALKESGGQLPYSDRNTRTRITFGARGTVCPASALDGRRHSTQQARWSDPYLVTSSPIQWCEVMQSWDRPPMTLDVEKVGFMAASLRAGRYRSAEPYINRARIEHIRRFDKSPGPAVLEAIRQYARTEERGTGHRD